MFHALPALWLALLTAVVALAASAQPAPPVPSMPAFQSAFEGYQAFADDPPIPWKQANETVHQRGGWKAYAQQAASAPAAASPPRGGHAGHAMPAGKARP